MDKQRAYSRSSTIFPIPDHISVLTWSTICSLGMERGVSAVVADGVEIFDLLLVLRSVVAKVEILSGRLILKTMSPTNVAVAASKVKGGVSHDV